MFIDEKQRGERRRAGIGVGGERNGDAVFAQSVDGRKLGVAQEIECAGQEHGGGARFRHRHDAGFVRVLDVIRGQRAEPCGECGAMQIRKLIRMEFYAQSVSLCGLEHTRDLLRRKRDAFAEGIDGVGQTFARDRRDHLVADACDVSILVAFRLRRQRMGAQERRDDVDRAPLAERARRPQLLLLLFERETVSRFDLDGRRTFRDQRIEARKRLLDQRDFAGLARGFDGRGNAAAGLRDLLHRWRRRA